MLRRPLSILLALVLAAASARADEGMWLPDAFPSATVQARYGFSPDAGWLKRVRLGALDLDGCSAGIVSAEGLVMTNHHCVEGCLTALSRPGGDMLASGMLARSAAEERRCPGMTAQQLIAIDDVTDRVEDATRGKAGAAFAAALGAVKATLENGCARGNAMRRCRVVTLYRGGRYALYKYRRFDDLRLVFTPESASADFGGDPDNFEFPRYAFDIAFLRLYRNGAPLDTSAWRLRLSNREVVPGELVFTAGNPARTERLDTLAQLEEERDHTLPRAAFYYAELRGLLTAFVRRGPEEARVGRADLLGVENTVKALRGLSAALSDPALFAAKRESEAALKAAVAADPALARATGDPWDDIARAIERHRAVALRYAMLEAYSGRASRLLRDAIILVRHAAEAAKPEGERLAGYTSASFPERRGVLLSDRPIAPDLEILELGYWLGKLQQWMGQDDPAVRTLLGDRSPEALAAALVKGTRLGDPALRRRLLDGGAAALARSHDPMLDFARTLDPLARAVRRTVEDDYDAVRDDAGGRIARASFALHGTALPPDATGTLRISFGTVEGWSEHGRGVPPLTRFSGLWARATGAPPFRLAPSWAAAKESLDPGTLFDFASSDDVVGGNSGSPVIDREGAVVGLVFDGNFPSLAGDYAFDPATNRTVSVAAPAIWAALAGIYHADRLVAELRD